nr:universal stress protein A-like protein [Ipomoea batatas]
MEAISTAPEQNRRVMVAMDDSEESFYALNWALENPFVYHTGPVVFATSTVIDTYRKSQQQMAKVVLSKALQMCKEKMVKAETLVVEGDPKDKICQAAEEMNVDLLVVGSRGLGNITRAFLGSVSDYCAHYAHCPVLIVKPTPKESPRVAP